MSSVDKTAVIYARYSSHGQTEQSIDGQIAAAQKYAEGKGYTIIHIYADRAMTGRNDDREQFQKMLSDTATHQFGVILLWKIDRFGRNREEIAFNRYRCKKNGVRVERVAEDVPDGPEGVILDSVLEGMAEYYSLQLAQNVRRGQRESAKKSQSNGGTRMIGYKVNPDTKRYEIDPDTAPFITEVFRRYAGGQTMAEIAAWLNAQGLRATRGGMFTVNSLHRLLKNEKYTGVYIFRDIRNEGGMPALIDRATFDKVQEMLKVNRRAPSRVWSRAEYLLTDKLFCGHCGAPMAGVSGHGHTGVKHNYYTCLNRKRKKSCTKKSVRQDVLEPLVLKSIRNLLQDDATLKYIADRVWAEYERSDTSGDTIRALDRQIADVDRALSNVMKAIEMGIINEMTKARMDELTEQKQALSAARADAGLARGFKLTRNMILYFLRKMAAMDISDRDSQKRLIKTFVNAIYLYDDHFDIAFNYTENGKVIVKMQEIDDASTGGAFGCCAQCPTKIKAPAVPRRVLLFWWSGGGGPAVPARWPMRNADAVRSSSSVESLSLYQWFARCLNALRTARLPLIQGRHKRTRCVCIVVSTNVGAAITAQSPRRVKTQPVLMRADRIHFELFRAGHCNQHGQHKNKQLLHCVLLKMGMKKPRCACIVVQ